MNFHKNHENSCTTKVDKGGHVKMNIFESLHQLVVGAEERFIKRLMDMKMKQAPAFYRRFTGKANRRRRVKR